MIPCTVPPKTGFTKEEEKQNWTLATSTPTLMTSKVGDRLKLLPLVEVLVADPHVSLPAYLAAPLDSIKQAWLGRTSESGQEYRVSRHNIFGMRGNGEEET